MIDLSLPPEFELLCIGAHPDDIEIGCGGSLLALRERHKITATSVVLTSVPQRRAEAQVATSAFLGTQARLVVGDLPDGRLPDSWNQAKQALEEVATTVRPHLIFAPRPDDSHQDHRLVGSLVSTVWRDAMVLHYEIPKWDGDLRPVTHYIPVSEEQAAAKYDLLTSSYPSQVGRDWWDREMFLGLLRLRGIECRSRYAEGFISPKTLLI